MSDIVSFEYQIKGSSWKIVIIPEKAYTSVVGGDHPGETEYDHITGHRLMRFNKDKFIKGLVVHEVTHAFMSDVPIESAGLSSNQTEEVICEMLEINFEDWLAAIEHIYDYGKQNGAQYAK